MQNSVHRFQQESRDRKIANFLLLELTIDLREPRVRGQRRFELLEDEGVRVDVLEVVVGRHGVEVPQDDVADPLLVAGLKTVTASLPDEDNYQFIFCFCIIS